MIVYEHDKPGLGESLGETFEPMFLHTRIAMRHRDGRMPGRPVLRHEEPSAETVTALDTEFHVAPLHHHALRSEAISVGISVPPSVEPLPYIVDRVLIEALIEATRDVADMRCRQQLRLAAKRMIGRQRLLVKDVDPGAGDFAVTQSRKQIRLDHDRPARRVY